jgi:hypothetical protein
VFSIVSLTLAAERSPLPESLLTESATDVDAEERGELEFEANVAAVGARRGGARALLTSFEVEWRVLREVGLRLEPAYAHVVDVGVGSGRNRFALAGALAVGLFHDYPRDDHLQMELLGRTPDAANARVFEPGETELPAAADLVGAARRGRWTLRTSVGVEAGGAFAHAPLHTDLALLATFREDERFGFFGIELRADWARDSPLVVAPDIVAITAPLGLPFSVSVALPVNVGAGASAASYGVFMRLMVLANREAEYARGDAN